MFKKPSHSPSTPAVPLFAFNRQSRHLKAAHELVHLIKKAFADRDAPGRVSASVEDLGNRFKKMMQNGEIEQWNTAIAIIRAQNEDRARKKAAFVAGADRQKTQVPAKVSKPAKKAGKPVDPRDSFDPFASKLDKTRLIEDSKPATHLKQYDAVKPVLYNVILECSSGGKICIAGLDFGGAILSGFEIRKADLTGVNFDEIDAKNGFKIQDCTYKGNNGPSFQKAHIRNAAFNNLRRIVFGTTLSAAEEKLKEARIQADRDIQAGKARIAEIRQIQIARLATEQPRMPGASEPTIKAAKKALQATRDGHAKAIRAARQALKDLRRNGSVNFKGADLLNVRFQNCDLPYANFLGAKLFHRVNETSINQSANFMVCDLTGARSLDHALEKVQPQKPRDQKRPMPKALAQFWQSIPAGGQMPKKQARGSFALQVVPSPEKDEAAKATPSRTRKPKP